MASRQTKSIVLSQLSWSAPNIFDGGYVTPNYNGVRNCSLCHPDAKAHPTDWQGNNDTSANGLHGQTLDGHTDGNQDQLFSLSQREFRHANSPMFGAPTCFEAAFENANNQGLIACHAGGPPGHDTDSFAWAGTCHDPAAYPTDAFHHLLPSFIHIPESENLVLGNPPPKKKSFDSIAMILL